MRRLVSPAAAAILVLGVASGKAVAAEALYSLPNGTYRAVEPPGWDKRAALPLVLFVHGYGQSSAEIVDDHDLTTAVTSLGALLVAPDGLRHAWGHVGAPSHDRDDIAFLRSVVADAKRRWPIDGSKVYASGFSTGASMVWDLACHAGQGFAAFLPVSGAFWLPYPARCEGGPVTLRHVHGLVDTMVPMAGRTIFGKYTQGDVGKSLDILRTIDGCAAEPDRTQIEEVPAWEKALNCQIWSSCASGHPLELCTHTDGHDMEPAFLHAGLVWALALRHP